MALSKEAQDAISRARSVCPKEATDAQILEVLEFRREKHLRAVMAAREALPGLAEAISHLKGEEPK